MNRHGSTKLTGLQSPFLLPRPVHFLAAIWHILSPPLTPMPGQLDRRPVAGDDVVAANRGSIVRLAPTGWTPEAGHSGGEEPYRGPRRNHSVAVSRFEFQQRVASCHSIKPPECRQRPVLNQDDLPFCKQRVASAQFYPRAEIPVFRIPEVPTRTEVLTFISKSASYGNLGLFVGAGFSKAVLNDPMKIALSWESYWNNRPRAEG